MLTERSARSLLGSPRPSGPSAWPGQPRQVRVEVGARGVALCTHLSAPVEVCDETGEPSYRVDQALLLPLADPSAVVHVRVTDAGGALLGQWVLTLKCLLWAPHHCKHASLQRNRADGGVRGVFLLCDEAMRGSAARALGAHTCGEGAAGEIDMALRWAHEPTLPPPPPPRDTPLAQLTTNSEETSLRLGNLGEVRAFLRRVPVLLRIEPETTRIRQLEFFVADLFNPCGDGSRSTSAPVRIGRLDFDDFHRGFPPADPGVTIWHFLSSFFISQAVPIVLSKGRAVGHVSTQIMSRFPKLILFSRLRSLGS